MPLKLVWHVNVNGYVLDKAVEKYLKILDKDDWPRSSIGFPEENFIFKTSDKPTRLFIVSRGKMESVMWVDESRWYANNQQTFAQLQWTISARFRVFETNQYTKCQPALFQRKQTSWFPTINSAVFSRNPLIWLTEDVYLRFPIRQHYNTFTYVYFRISRNMFRSCGGATRY